MHRRFFIVKADERHVDRGRSSVNKRLFCADMKRKKWSFAGANITMYTITSSSADLTGTNKHCSGTIPRNYSRSSSTGPYCMTALKLKHHIDLYCTSTRALHTIEKRRGGYCYKRTLALSVLEFLYLTVSLFINNAPFVLFRSIIVFHNLPHLWCTIYKTTNCSFTFMWQ